MFFFFSFMLCIFRQFSEKVNIFGDFYVNSIQHQKKKKKKEYFSALHFLRQIYTLAVPIKSSQFVWQSNKNRFMSKICCANMMKNARTHIQMCVRKTPRTIYARFLRTDIFDPKKSQKLRCVALTDFHIIMMHRQIIVFAAFQHRPNNRPKIKSYQGDIL